jgi:hypothetical protein
MTACAYRTLAKIIAVGEGLRHGGIENGASVWCCDVGKNASLGRVGAAIRVSGFFRVAVGDRKASSEHL